MPGEINSGDIAKIVSFRNQVVRGLQSAGIGRADEGDEILFWAIGEDWKKLDPQHWPERIRKNTGLIVTKEPVSYTMGAIVQIWERKKKIIIP